MRKLLCLCMSASLLILFTLAGCSGSSTQSPQKVVASFLDTCQKGDLEAAQKYTVGQDTDFLNENNPGTPAFVEEMLSKLTYGNISESIDGEVAHVNLEITNVNMVVLMSSLLSEMIGLAFSGDSSEDYDAVMEKRISEMINSSDAVKITTKVDVELTKVDSQWKIDPNDELINAMFGGMLDFANAWDS